MPYIADVIGKLREDNLALLRRIEVLEAQSRHALAQIDDIRHDHRRLKNELNEPVYYVAKEAEDGVSQDYQA